ncbi:ClpP/crotonase [Saitoella complicata NRRL Y-17804]|nr:ClpP/crotonase [Saitoella complicata NRRL Y-17804]ODQ52395.1 ClpP/crotonase [Saitoella complicata NRRL Y-17804]
MIIADSIAFITLQSPALTDEAITALTEQFNDLAHNSDIHTIVLTSAHPKFFCTGLYLGSSGSVATGAAVEKRFAQLKGLFDSVDQCPKTTVALINGACFGGGVGLAFSCDIRIAVKQATFTLSEVKLGLVPATISKCVVREWGPALSREAMITARPVRAAELHERGIIHAIVDDLKAGQQEVNKYLNFLRGGAPRAQSQVKELVRTIAEDTAETYQTKIKEIYIDMMGPSEEAKLGLDAFRKATKAKDKKPVDWVALLRKNRTKPKL